MANKANKDALESVGGGDVFAPPEWKLTIAEEDPAHPQHHEHVDRIRRDDPENIALLESLRLYGWRKSETIPVYKSGEKWHPSNGRRRLTFLRIVNKERETAKDPRGPIRPRVVLDDDPALTTAMSNEMHKRDPPMTRARRFVELRDVMGAAKAAAAMGETLANANLLAQCLTLPASAQAQVNRGEVPADVAARASKKGGAEAVAAVVEAGKGADGKVEPAKVRAAAKELPKRPKAIPRPVALALADRLTKDDFVLTGKMGDNLAALVRYILGDKSAANGREWLRAASIDAEAAAKGKGDEEGAE